MENFKENIIENIYNELSKVRKTINTNPTEKQKEAGNYRMGHIKILGFDITIENPKDSIRRGKDRNGKEWKVKMKYDYGYFTKTLGYDGDAVDVFIGNNLESEKIFAIDQFLGGKFDETKFMLGFNSKEEAKQAYLSNYEKDWKGFKEITEININDFKEWLYNGKQQRKPFYQYKSLKRFFITEAQRKFINKTLNLNEGRKKVTKNDKGEIVPDVCPKCGAKIGLYIHGEPVYLCSNEKCGAYYGTMPCRFK